MLNSILVIGGIVIMIISTIQCLRLIKINPNKNLRWQWYSLLCFILFFLVGYIAIFLMNITSKVIPLNSLLISLILFFGSVFVIGVLTVSYQLVSVLIQKTKELSLSNKTISENSELLRNKQIDLEKMESILKEKNNELEKTLEDFYTVRLGMEKDIQAGKLEEENKNIKNRLDALKTQHHN